METATDIVTRRCRTANVDPAQALGCLLHAMWERHVHAAAAIGFDGGAAENRSTAHVDIDALAGLTGRMPTSLLDAIGITAEYTSRLEASNARNLRDNHRRPVEAAEVQRAADALAVVRQIARDLTNSADAVAIDYRVRVDPPERRRR